MKKIATFTVLMLALVFTSSSHALPLSVKIDMLKTQLVEQLKANNYSAALQTIQDLRASGAQLPASFEYFEGKALFESGQQAASYDKFAHYAETQGKNGKYYKETIAYLVKAEEAKEEETKARLKMASSKPFINSLNMTFVPIQPGMFMMGSNHGDSGNKPVHSVTLSKGYYMQTTEVTQGQWEKLMGTNVRQQRDKSKYRRIRLIGEGENYPIYYVSWEEAQEFIRKLNAKEGTNKYRLPTEAEWEYAARAGSDTRLAGLGGYAWYADNSGGKTHRVAQKKANAWGLYDMHGNVWEWCHDWYGDYPSGSVTDPKGASSGSKRVLRGCNWDCTAGIYPSALREKAWPGTRSYVLGFRLAFSPGQ